MRKVYALVQRASGQIDVVGYQAECSRSRPEVAARLDIALEILRRKGFEVNFESTERLKGDYAFPPPAAGYVEV